MKQKTIDRNFLLLDDDEAKDTSKNISGASTSAQTAAHDSRGKKRQLLDGHKEDEEEEFNADYILETDYGFMERADTVLSLKKGRKGTALNDLEEEDEDEYGEEKEGAQNEHGTTNDNKDKFNMKFLDGNLEQFNKFLEFISDGGSRPTRKEVNRTISKTSYKSSALFK